MKVGLVDVDFESRGKCTYPNLALMKLSAWHKARGDEVEWYFPIGDQYDIVYMSKVFSEEYTRDYQYPIYADKIVRGGADTLSVSVTMGRRCMTNQKTHR